MSVTPNLGLTKPDVGSTGWGGPVNTNFDTLDTVFKQPSANEIHVYPGDSIQNAINTVQGLGGTIYLHPGTHTFSSTLLLTDADSLSIIGSGQGTILNYTGSGVAIDVTISAGGCDDVLMTDFDLVNGGTGTVGIRVNSSTQYVHRYINLNIKEFSTAGIQLGTNVRGFLISGCNIVDNGIGIIASNVTRARIFGNTIFNNTTIGIQVKGSSQWVKVIGNEVLSGSTAGISIEDSSVDCLVEANSCNGQSGYGIKVDTANRTTVVGNNVYGTTLSGIYANSSSDIQITGNVCSNCTVDGIALVGVTTSGIVGNRCKSNTGNGISATSTCSQNLIESNEVRGNTAISVLDNGNSERVETFEIFSDFLNALNGTPFTAAATGTGASGSNTVAGDGNHVGIVEVNTGTTTTGAGGFMTDASAIRLGGGEAMFEALVQVPTLPDGTNSFAFRVGFGDSNGADMTDGVYFELTQASANWQCATSSNSTRTKTSSGVAAVAATWVRLKVVVNAAGNSAKFYINGTLVVTTATNIPTSAGRELGIATNIVKSAGTTARTAQIDYAQAKILITTAR